jgi:hypothetical protein
MLSDFFFFPPGTSGITPSKELRERLAILTEHVPSLAKAHYLKYVFCEFFVEKSVERS